MNSVKVFSMQRSLCGPVNEEKKNKSVACAS